ncbi:hypothetical protein [Microbulbifer taiwanensis]|uniref:Spy/CpxP family protein refolding chaperone n=1 Tax=Microbulbifer taiwanensis TaxID=986746 RepID=A0ABW1YK97_9GAMM|nr:hypothetical protein [Microbulbifer taiwanensis]
MQALTNCRLTTLLLTAALLICGGMAQADDKELGTDFWEKYDDIADWLTLRLKLTPEQEDKALPILDKTFDDQLALLKEYGIEVGKEKEKPKLSVKQREELDAKMIAIRAETRAKLVPLLNADQLKELKKVQEEFHEEFRKRLAEE